MQLWQSLSIVAIGFYLALKYVQHSAHERYPVSRLLAFLIVLVAGAAIWIKTKQVAADYREEGFLDALLAVAMICAIFEFVVLVLRASAIHISEQVEQRSLQMIVIMGALAAFFFARFATPAQFELFDGYINMFIRPFWLVVLVIFIVQHAHQRREQ